MHALAADPGALDAELRAHADALRGLARRLCRDATEAEDLVQDTLERALSSISTFTPGTNARAWLVSILHHLFIDRCRRRSREGAAVQLELVENHLEHPVPELEPRWAKLDRTDVEQALGRLDAPFRDVYRLHVDGASYEQISKTLGVPRTTVGTRLLRARHKLKALLFGEEEEPA
ncbi:MAG: RNA polymerase sigma factor [Archangiaceae bacterium]|nr:RNA polymerase sigma factor [Archangiaceae bacterium]